MSNAAVELRAEQVSMLTAARHNQPVATDGQQQSELTTSHTSRSSDHQIKHLAGKIYELDGFTADVAALTLSSAGLC